MALDFLPPDFPLQGKNKPLLGKATWLDLGYRQADAIPMDATAESNVWFSNM